MGNACFSKILPSSTGQPIQDDLISHRLQPEYSQTNLQWIEHDFDTCCSLQTDLNSPSWFLMRPFAPFTIFQPSICSSVSFSTYREWKYTIKEWLVFHGIRFTLQLCTYNTNNQMKEWVINFDTRNIEIGNSQFWWQEDFQWASQNFTDAININLH